MNNKAKFGDLADKLRIDVRTLNTWRKKEGFPHEGTFEQIKAWADSEGLGAIKVNTVGLAELKADLMREQIKLARMKNEREAGEVVASEVVDEMFATLAQKLDLLLRLKLEVELGQRVIGKNAAEANVEGALILDEIREVINSNIAIYQGEMISRSANMEDDA